MRASQLISAIQTAIKVAQEKGANVDADERARTFVAALSGALMLQDEKLSNEIFAVLNRS